MKQFLLVRIPSVCICFTAIILCSFGMNLLSGHSVSTFPFQAFGWIWACQVIDWLLCHLNFKSWLQYYLVETSILYVTTLAAVHVFHWIAITVPSIVSFSILFLAVDSFVFWYFYRRQRLLAQELNQLLQAQQRDSGTEA